MLKETIDMKPTIYLYEDELRKALPQLSQNNVRGIAFEWKDEDVYHVHTSFPSVAPSGYPKIAMIYKVPLEQFYAIDDNAIMKMLNSNSDTQQILLQGGIIVILSMDEIALLKKAYRLNKNTYLLEDCTVKYVPLREQLYSRSKGLLETDILETKKVMVVGLGSFGSQIAIELAKSGIGNFVLIDFDRVELHNLARHTCGVNDLGRYKTRAVKDQILLKNPYSQVETFEFSVLKNQELFQNLMTNCDLIICATDNNPSRMLINGLGISLKKTVIFGRAFTRAIGGDVFRLRENGPCYACLVDSLNLQEEEISQISQAQEMSPSYVPQEEVKAIVQVGLSSDITPICNFMVKLSLIELSRGLSSGIQSLETELIYDYYFWINRRDNHYQAFAPFANANLRPTILKWYGVDLEKDSDCITCLSHQ